MPPRKKRPRDANQLAKAIVDIATEEAADVGQSPEQQRAAKGGKIGGAARARALTQEQRSEIARIAASARWKKRD